MKAIQSFWVLPGNQNNGGWINKRYEFISWSLSYILLKKNFEKVALNTNVEGAGMLTEVLGLQYDEVKTDLEEMTDMLSKMWVLGKMYTYATQDEPFVHVDGDVFWFTLPSEEFFKSGVIAQSIEMDESSYKNIWLNIQKYAKDLPEYMNTAYSRLGMAANMGIAGGTDYQTFKPFYEDALAFTEANLGVITQREEFRFLYVYLEQALFLAYLNAKKQKPAFLKKPVFRTNFEEVTDFNNLNPKTGAPDFIHLLASFKYRIQYCNLMEYWLYKAWPEQLEKIDKLCSDQPELSHDLHIWLNPAYEKKLPFAERVFTMPDEVLNHPYVRLSELLKSEIKDQNKELVSEMISVCNEPEKAADCYQFETSRQNILQYLLQKTSQESLFRQFEIHRDFCVLPLEEVLSYNIVLNPALCLKSTFNWFNDLVYNAGHYWYKVSLSSDCLCFQELLLTEPECQVLDILNGKMTLKAITEAWSDQNQVPLNPKAVSAIHKMIKELLSLDMITVVR